jgi:UDP-N-acetylmuramyl pentapeptide phosphotransferase/UDP-N-acetylglucosamine-1-phosphate transferase
VDRDTEIAQLNHELEILRERLASYERNVRIVKTFFMWFCIVPLFSILAIISFQDPATGLFIGAGLVVMCLVALLWYSLDTDKQWVVTVFIGAVFGYFTFQRVSDGQIIEEQITKRERRLAELG